MIDFVIALILSVLATILLLLHLACVLASWRTVSIFYNLARLALPLLVLGYFAPSLFDPHFHETHRWVRLAFLGGLGLVGLAYLVHLYRSPEGDRKLAAAPAAAPRSGNVILRAARPEDLPAAAAIFVEVFQRRFDPHLGSDHQRNAQVLADLLVGRRSEVEVAVDAASGQVVGAIWLEQGDPTVPPVTPALGWPVLRHYCNPLHAAYGALFGLGSLMGSHANGQQAYLQWVGVDPRWRGQGIGRRLVERALEVSRCAGKGELRLHTERTNRPARALYQKLGFTERAAWPLSPRVAYVKSLNAQIC